MSRAGGRTANARDVPPLLNMRCTGPATVALPRHPRGGTKGGKNTARGAKKHFFAQGLSPTKQKPCRILPNPIKNSHFEVPFI